MSFVNSTDDCKYLIEGNMASPTATDEALSLGYHSIHLQNSSLIFIVSVRSFFLIWQVLLSHEERYT